MFPTFSFRFQTITFLQEDPRIPTENESFRERLILTIICIWLLILCVGVKKHAYKIRGPLYTPAHSCISVPLSVQFPCKKRAPFHKCL